MMIPLFTFNGYVIENIAHLTYLGHIMTNNLTVDEMFLFRRNDSVGQVNNVSCYFQYSKCSMNLYGKFYQQSSRLVYMVTLSQV
jgi:hypothetical protein